MATVRSWGGILRLPKPVRLEGQSFARVDVRRRGVAALPTLSVATGPVRTGACLVGAPTPPTSTTVAPSTQPGGLRTTTTAPPA